MADRNYERSAYEAGLDIDFDIRLHELHERLFRNVRWLIAFVQLLAASAAMAPLLGAGGPWLVAASGFVLAIITIVDVISDFAGSRQKHCAQRQRYQDLRAATASLTLHEIDAQRQLLSKDDPVPIEALRKPAYNDNLRRHGRESYATDLSLLERLFVALA